MKALVLAAPLLVLAAAFPAYAHDDYDRHESDHTEHYRFHDDVNEVHEQAHEEGFRTRAEHRAYHRGLSDLHGGFHDRHPFTRHDHQERHRWWSRYW